MQLLHLKRRFMKHFVSCTPLACQAHKSMKRHCVPWSTPSVYDAKPFQASFPPWKIKATLSAAWYFLWWSRCGLFRSEIQLKKCCKSVIYPELWHVMAQRHQTSGIDFLGNKWGKSSFAGKKRGILNAKQPISKRESNHHPCRFGDSKI